MSSNESTAEQRAFDIASADLHKRVTWAENCTASVTDAGGGSYEVSFLRMLPAGSPSLRGGGIDAGVTYHVSAAGVIERITYPR